jgi:hypothetical protein
MGRIYTASSKTRLMPSVTSTTTQVIKFRTINNQQSCVEQMEVAAKRCCNTQQLVDPLPNSTPSQTKLK